MIKLTDEEKMLIRDGKPYLKRNDFSGFYRNLNSQVGRWYDANCVGHITQFFLENGVNVFDYTDIVYKNMFNGAEIENIVIPDGVRRIQADAFANCENLKNVDLGNTVTTIDSGAFANCGRLKNLFLPDSVTTLGQDIFKGCNNIPIVANKRTGANRLRCKQGEIPWYKDHLFMRNDDTEEGGE